MQIVNILEKTVSIASLAANAYIDFSKMTCSVVAVVTDVVRDGRPVVGYGFDSHGRYGQGALMRDLFVARVLKADPETLIDRNDDNLDPFAVWTALMTNEKPGGHGERSVAAGTPDMAVWDAVAKIDRKPLWRLLAERYRGGMPIIRPGYTQRAVTTILRRITASSRTRCGVISIAAKRWSR